MDALCDRRCGTFIKFLIQREGEKRQAKRRSLWIHDIIDRDTGEASQSIDAIVSAFHNVEDMIWYLTWHSQKNSEVRKVPNRFVGYAAAESQLFDYLVVSVISRKELEMPIVQFVVDYKERLNQRALDMDTDAQRHLHRNFSTIFIEWIYVYAKVAKMDILRFLFDSRQIFGIADDIGGDAFSDALLSECVISILEGAAKGHQPCSLRFVLPLLRLISPPDEIIEAIRSRFLMATFSEYGLKGEYGKREEFCQCVKVIMEEFPPAAALALLPQTVGDPKTFSVGTLMGFGSVPAMKYLLLERKVPFDPRCLDYFISHHFDTYSVIPHQSIPVLKFLLDNGFELNVDYILENLSLNRMLPLLLWMRMGEGFDFYKSVFRKDALAYVEFLFSLFQERIFKYFDWRCLLKCLDSVEQERRWADIPLGDYLDALRFCIEKSGLRLNSNWEEAVDARVSSPYIRELLHTMGNEIRERHDERGGESIAKRIGRRARSAQTKHQANEPEQTAVDESVKEQKVSGNGKRRRSKVNTDEEAEEEQVKEKQSRKKPKRF